MCFSYMNRFSYDVVKLVQLIRYDGDDGLGVYVGRLNVIYKNGCIF